MDIVLLGITIVSLVVAFIMSAAAWRLTRDEKARSAARVAALSAAASAATDAGETPGVRATTATREAVPTAAERPAAVKAPWAPAPRAAFDSSPSTFDADGLSLRSPGTAAAQAEPAVSHASGFLGASPVQREAGGGQKSLAFAAAILFAVLSGGLVWMMSGPEGTSPVAVGPNSPLELVSLTHARQNDKLAVSGLVRNPSAGQPVERLSAVVFLFDRAGTFVTSSRAHVDFLKLGSGDESPFVVSLDAPSTVARYRVSFRTDDGVVPHVDRRSDAPSSGAEQPLYVTATK